MLNKLLGVQCSVHGAYPLPTSIDFIELKLLKTIFNDPDSCIFQSILLANSFDKLSGEERKNWRT